MTHRASLGVHGLHRMYKWLFAGPIQKIDAKYFTESHSDILYIHI